MLVIHDMATIKNVTNDTKKVKLQSKIAYTTSNLSKQISHEFITINTVLKIPVT